MTHDEAEEYTQALGQVVAGGGDRLPWGKNSACPRP